MLEYAALRSLARATALRGSGSQGDASASRAGRSQPGNHAVVVPRALRTTVIRQRADVRHERLRRSTRSPDVAALDGNDVHGSLAAGAPG